MGQKISELTDGVTAQGSDLVRIARSSGGSYIDRRLSLGDLSALLTNVTITGGGVSSWDMKNVTLQGGPSDAADVIDTGGFPNIWATVTVPTLGRVRFEKPLN